MTRPIVLTGHNVNRAHKQAKPYLFKASPWLMLIVRFVRDYLMWMRLMIAVAKVAGNVQNRHIACGILDKN